MKNHQLGLFSCTGVVKGRIREILKGLNSETTTALLSSLVLDQIIILIDKFPLQYQKKIVALLADGYLEKWNKQEKTKDEKQAN